MTIRSFARLTIASLALAAASPASGDWPSFRGPRASGVAAEARPPAEWDATARRNVRWHAAIPGLSHASPIVWADRVYVVTAVAETASDLDLKAEGVVFAKDTVRHTWRIMAFDRRSGRAIWDRIAHQATPAQPRHVRGTYANATPATDGRVIVAVLGNEGLFAFDMDGRPKWRAPLAPSDASWNLDPASSPVLFEGLAIVQSDYMKEGFLAAFDADTGQERWRVPRSEGLAWSTPTVWTPRGEPPQLVVNSARWIRSYEPATGREIWRIDNSAQGSWDRVATPIATEDLVIVTGSGNERPIVALRAAARGEHTLTPGGAVAWIVERGAPYLATPLVYQGLLYVLAGNGVLSVYRVETGALVYRSRLSETPATFSASPVAANGLIYFTSDEGDVIVLRAAERFERVAINRMNEPCFATPAIAGDTLFIRTARRLFAIGSTP